MSITAAKALALIQKFPKAATFTTATQTYNPATGATTESGAVNHSVTTSPPIPYELRYVDGDIIKATDVMVVLSSSGISFTPDEGQKVTYGSEIYRVVSVEKLDVGGTDAVVAYIVQLRR